MKFKLSPAPKPTELLNVRSRSKPDHRLMNHDHTLNKRNRKTERRGSVFQGEREGASERAASISSESKGETRMTKSEGLGNCGCLFTSGAELLTLFSFNPSVWQREKGEGCEVWSE